MDQTCFQLFFTKNGKNENEFLLVELQIVWIEQIFFIERILFSSRVIWYFFLKSKQKKIVSINLSLLDLNSNSIERTLLTGTFRSELFEQIMFKVFSDLRFANHSHLYLF